MPLRRTSGTVLALLLSASLAAAEGTGCAQSANAGTSVSMRDEAFATQRSWSIGQRLRVRHQPGVSLRTMQRPVCYRVPACELQATLAALR